MLPLRNFAQSVCANMTIWSLDKKHRKALLEHIEKLVEEKHFDKYNKKKGYKTDLTFGELFVSKKSLHETLKKNADFWMYSHPRDLQAQGCSTLFVSAQHNLAEHLDKEHTGYGHPAAGVREAAATAVVAFYYLSYIPLTPYVIRPGLARRPLRLFTLLTPFRLLQAGLKTWADKDCRYFVEIEKPNDGEDECPLGDYRVVLGEQYTTGAKDPVWHKAVGGASCQFVKVCENICAFFHKLAVL